MPDSMIKTYYDNLSRKKLIGCKCEKCGAIAYPPTAACPNCGGFQHKEVELSGRGEALFISHSMAPPPNPRFNEIAPYAYGHVKLKEGVFVQGVITGIEIDPESLKKRFEAGPAPVEAHILSLGGLPVLAFRLV
jgi:uncharacterized OB-fold protein